MSFDEGKLYPGATATAEQVAMLAQEYKLAAENLLASGRRGGLLSTCPYRLVAIHAIELYLNAYLLAAGHSSTKVRGLQHDLSSRTTLAVEARLCLRKRTFLHLQALSNTREYLITRYDPALSTASHLNRLGATLDEVAEKVMRYLGDAGAVQR
ncbi:hypothetical protein P6144_13000 [Sphingomonas sp. HITSZ_GF]|uniref:hypothetical protein n=1 Tax=Sphingomonas sp. HITSZ_GF TaxID=3037247 RepID=UPI00240DD767|nr:hypothetical protein [Sphingomonas sp. HITSZ_GF]MDG2534572.1 hypothetical protein [Sphingomonas sp. HITSZ_GF]